MDYQLEIREWHNNILTATSRSRDRYEIIYWEVVNGNIWTRYLGVVTEVFYCVKQAMEEIAMIIENHACAVTSTQEDKKQEIIRLTEEAREDLYARLR
jgi:hypothetical protein